MSPDAVEELNIVAEYGPLCEAMYLMMSADGSVGAELQASGWSSESLGVWSYTWQGTGTPYGAPNAFDPITLSLPLRGRDDPPGFLTLFANNGLMTAFARRSDIRVVDTVAPTISDSVITAPCGWGSSVPPDAELDPLHPKRCIDIGGDMSDACTATPTGRLVDLWVFDQSWNLLRYQKGGCITAQPGYLDANLSQLYYVATWQAVDSWSNASSLRLVYFKVIPETSTATCSAPRSVNEIYDAPY